MIDSLETYVEHARDVIEQAPQMGETNTKEMLVRRFIKVWGWTFHPSEITLEYPVRMASQRTKVDYALLLDGTPTVFVEAKGLDTTLSDGHREQLTSYMHNEEGVEWGLLTNGAAYEMYRYDGTPSGIQLGAVDLDHLVEWPHLVRALSKDSVEAGESEQIARRIREQRQAISTLHADKDDIAAAIVQLLRSKVGDSIAATVETEAKELIDRVVASLENGEQPHRIREPNPDASATAASSSADIVLMREGEPATSFHGQTQAAAMVSAVAYLIEEANLLKGISMPYVPGKSKAVLNTKPEHPNGNVMRSYTQVFDQCYLDTNMNKESKEKELNRLAAKCGISCNFNW